MARNILHCDMNNFYASVECMLNPALKEYPVAVCGSVEERHGIVLAKNYKAKAFDVKTGDTVKVLSGEEKGKQGKVVAVSPKEGKLIIEGVNMVSKHVKPRQMGQEGGIIKTEGAMYACKVQVVCPKCSAAVRTGHKVAEDGSKLRVCKKCGETF